MLFNFYKSKGREARKKGKIKNKKIKKIKEDKAKEDIDFPKKGSGPLN